MVRIISTRDLQSDEYGGCDGIAWEIEQIAGQATEQDITISVPDPEPLDTVTFGARVQQKEIL